MRNIQKRIEKLLASRVNTYLILALLSLAALIFVNHNYALYKQPIAKIKSVKIMEENQITKNQTIVDQVYTQQLIAEIKNGENKGKDIQLLNTYSSSGAFDQGFAVGDEIFVTLHKEQENDWLTGTIKDVKRDKYIMFVALMFVITLLLIGKKQGFYSIIGLVINVALLSYALDIYIKNANMSLLFICMVSAVLFTVISLVLINGLNGKTYAAIISTLLGTFISLLLAFLVIKLTGENGLRYEEMQFLTRPYRAVFMAGLFLGSLGGAMDIAITMSSSIFGLYERNQQIDTKALRASGMEIGKDIMGTMTNILFFVYISGSIPMMILYVSNGSTLSFTLSMNLSLEISRALAGGIGIVLTIPISLIIAIFFVNRKRAKQ